MPGTEVGLESFNGFPGLVARIDGRPVTAVAIDVRGNSVQAVHAVANPAKLAALNPDRTSLVR